MVSIALGSMAAQAGRTSTASLLALGLARQRRRVEFVQVHTTSSKPVPDSVLSPLVDCSLVNIDERDGWEGRLAARARASRTKGRDVVIDLPAVSLSGRGTLLAALDTVLIPLGPGFAAREGAVAFWEGVIRSLLETPVKYNRVSVKLLPVGWSDVDAAVSEAIRLRDGLANTHRYFLPPPEVVPWNVPTDVPRALAALGDCGDLTWDPALGPLARQLAQVLGCWQGDLEGTFLGVLPIPEPAVPRGRMAEHWHQAKSLCGTSSGASIPSKQKK